MVLAAGTFFWLARALLALVAVRGAALAGQEDRRGRRRWSAPTAYCVFSGSEVATERSLIMTLVMLGAILVDRPALSHAQPRARGADRARARARDAARPELPDVVRGGRGADRRRRDGTRRRPAPSEPPAGRAGAVRWLVAASLGIVATTIVATLATAPFGAYHFQTLNPFGLHRQRAGAAARLARRHALRRLRRRSPIRSGSTGRSGRLMGIAVEEVLERLGLGQRASTGSTVIVPAFGAAALGCLSSRS